MVHTRLIAWEIETLLYLAQYLEKLILKRYRFEGLTAWVTAELIQPIALCIYLVQQNRLPSSWACSSLPPESAQFLLLLLSGPGGGDQQSNKSLFHGGLQNYHVISIDTSFAPFVKKKLYPAYEEYYIFKPSQFELTSLKLSTFNEKWRVAVTHVNASTKHHPDPPSMACRRPD